MDRLISLEPSNVVAIRIEHGQKCCGELTLRNVMYTMPVAFRLQPVNRSRYTVKPQSGIITPLSTVTVEITYHLPPGAVLPDTFPYCDDSFLLHSVVVPGAAVKDSGSTLDSVPSDWFTAKKKQVFIDSGIRVMFLGSQVISRLVFEGNSVDEIRTVLERSDPSWRAADSMDDLGRTLLHLAISLGRPDLVQLLLEFGPDIEARSRSGCSPLEAAAASGETLIAELLLAHGAITEQSNTSARGPIHLAVGGGHTEVLKLLLHKGANVNATTRDGNTALHIAAKDRWRDCARILISNGAQPDVRNTVDLETPLHIVARSGDEHMIRFLLHKGANKEIRNRYTKTAYDVAAEHGHVKLFDALKLGDKLCIAARKGDVRMIQRLIEGGAAVNGRDHHGWTPLHRAAFKGQTDAVRVLIEKGAECDSKDEDGYTALHCAAESGHADVIELLVKKRADTEARTNKGMTALQIAESLHYSGITRMLSSNVTGYKEGAYTIRGYGSAHYRKGSGTREARSPDIKKRHSRGRPIHSSMDRSTVPVAVL